MANHKSAQKRVRSDKEKYMHNRYLLKTCKTFIKKMKIITSKEDYFGMLKEAASKLDKLAKRRIIHSNKAAGMKSKLHLVFNKMSLA